LDAKLARKTSNKLSRSEVCLAQSKVVPRSVPVFKGLAVIHKTEQSVICKDGFFPHDSPGFGTPNAGDTAPSERCSYGVGSAAREHQAKFS